MISKEWYRSKTIWAAIFLFLTAAYQVAITGEIDPDVMSKIFAALGLAGLRQAVD